MTVLLQTLAPIALLVAVGAVAQRLLGFDLRALSRLTLYVLSPALVIHSLATTQLPVGSALRMLAGFALATVGLFVIAVLAGRLGGLEAARRKGLIATTLFGNTGNMGLPLIFFAFGDDGLQRAVLVYLASAVLVFGFGPALVQGGGLLSGLRTVARLPLLWALAIGLVLNLTGWRLPWRLDEGVEMLALAAVPVLLLLLGMQVVSGRLRPTRLVLGASVLRLVASPVLALLAGRLVGLDALSLQVLVLQSATPTAVNAILIAGEFGGDVQATSQVVVVSTGLCLLTIPLVLWLL